MKLRGLAEQVRHTKHHSPRSRRIEKRRAARLRRRYEKVDPENAPLRVTKGWAD